MIRSGGESNRIARELNVTKAAGIGGVEIQPVYPVELDDPGGGFPTEFPDSMRFAATTARQLGLSVDIAGR